MSHLSKDPRCFLKKCSLDHLLGHLIFGHAFGWETVMIPKTIGVVFDRNSIFTEIPKHRKPKKNYRNRNYRTEIVPNQIVNKFNVSKMKLCLKTCWKCFWVLNWSNWMHKYRNLTFFPFFQNYKKIIFRNCPILSIFMECFEGFFSVFFGIPKQCFGATTETHRNSISVELPNWTEISVEH